MQMPSITRPKMLVLALALAAGGCGQTLTPQEHVAKASDYFESGALDAATIELSNALQQEPGNADARWIMARISMTRGDAAKAERDARRAMELGIAQADARPLLVRAILLQGEPDRAIAEATAVPPDFPAPQHAALLGLRSQAHVLKGELDEALAAAEQALALNPGNIEALVAQTVIRTLRGQHDEAAQWAGRALEADGRSADAWGALGELELARGNAAEAEVAFGNAIEHRGFTTLDRARRALARLQLDKFDEAQADIDALAARGLKNHPYVNHLLGLTRFGQGDYRGAATAFEAANAVQPDSIHTRLYLGITHYFLGNLEQARHHAEWVQANAPHSGFAGQFFGIVSASLSDYETASDALGAVLETQPNDPLTLNLLSNVALLAGRSAEALEFATRLVAADPQSDQAQKNLMVARLMAGESLDELPRQAEPATQDDAFTRDFLRALGAFRENRMGDVLERAAQLHERFPEKADPLNLLAAAQLATGQWEAARQTFEKVLQLAPENTVARRNLAKIELQAGNHDAAMARLRALSGEYPADEELALLLASAYFNQNEDAAAIALLEGVVAENDAALPARAQLAAAYLRSGQLDRVLALTQGLSSAQLRQAPELLEIRGKAQSQAGDLAAARNTFEQWVRLLPSSAAARFYLSDSLARSGDSARAFAELERTLALDPGHLPARVGQVKMHVQRGDIELARETLEALRTDFGDRNEVLGIEGWFALGTGDFTRAEDRFRTLLERAPHTEIIALLSKALWAQGAHDAAITELERWLQSRGDDVPVQLLAADAYLAKGQIANARASYQAILSHQPDHVVALNNLAWLVRESAPDQAMAHAQRAHELAPDNPHVLDTMGMLRLERGALDEAFDFVSRAADRAPDDPQIQLHLGQVLVAQGRLGEARRILSALADNTSGNAIGEQALAIIESIDSTPQ